uniref:Interleukin-1 receptor-associated kinase 4 n=1 Tax=Electrophorus electricus TaxID=8005 RepID=A0AAY5F576_ELEEL
MSNPVTSETLIRKLKHSVLKNLSDFLDPHDEWKTVLMDIQKPTGEPRYTQLHVRRFQRLVAQGKSPTVELLFDWGTTDSTVGELFEILNRHKFLTMARLISKYSRPFRAININISHGIILLCFTLNPGFYTFTFHELTQITKSWDDRPVSAGGSRLGEGGFGTVFKGLLNSTPVAVKKLNLVDDMSPEDLKTQFIQEIQTLKRLQHKNLVNMVGYSSDGQHSCLVYAYMSNGSLLDRLACLEGSTALPWQVRCAVALGTARGLEYLHHQNHIHRDVKSGNILLDEDFIPKISDFGLTRASSKRSCTTVITERIVGTTAYMAPEALRGEITPKSDVFSFGVVLLEILSGLPPVDENRDPKLLMEMKDEIDDEEITLQEFIDNKMEGWDMDCVEKMYSVASRCLSERKNRRPLLKEVLTELEDFI